MESTNNRQAAFVVNRKAVESTNDIQNINFGLKLTRVIKSVMIRLVQKNGMRYLTLLSDGDAKTWTRLNELAPYGKSILIE